MPFQKADDHLGLGVRRATPGARTGSVPRHCEAALSSPRGRPGAPRRRPRRRRRPGAARPRPRRAVVALGGLVDVAGGVVDARAGTLRARLVVARVEGLLELLGGGARQGGLLELARLGLGGGEDAVLHRRGVHVDVLLAGQQHQLVHDLVGDRAQDEAVVLHALVAGEVERLADLDADPDELGDLGAGGLGLVGADHRDGQDLDPALEGHPGDTGAAAVEPAVGAAGALGVDAEQLAAAQHPQAGAQGRLAGPTAGAVDGQLADAAEERGRRADP